MKRILVAFLMVLAILAVCAPGASAFEVENLYGSVGTAFEYDNLSTDSVKNLGLNVEFKGSLVEDERGAAGLILRGATETGHGLETAYNDADKTAGAYVRLNKLPIAVELQVTHTNFGVPVGADYEDRVVLYFGKITSW